MNEMAVPWFMRPPLACPAQLSTACTVEWRGVYPTSSVSLRVSTPRP